MSLPQKWKNKKIQIQERDPVLWKMQMYCLQALAVALVILYIVSVYQSHQIFPFENQAWLQLTINALILKSYVNAQFSSVFILQKWKLVCFVTRQHQTGRWRRTRPPPKCFLLLYPYRLFLSPRLIRLKCLFPFFSPFFFCLGLHML